MQLRRRISLVDRDPAVRASLEFSLELEGFEVRSFESGETALGSVGILDADILIIEHRQAEMDGLALLGHLRFLGARAPAIIMASNPTNVLRRQVADAGALLVEKPLLSDSLSEALRSRP